MKVVCGRGELAGRLALAARAAAARGAIQVLAGMRLEAAGGELRLAATDMELSLRVALPTRVEAEGGAVVPARALVEIVRLMPDETVELDATDPAALRIVSGGASYTLNAYPLEDFPRLPEVRLERTFAVDAPGFLATVARVARAASRDASRPLYTGILARLEPGKVVMAATDGHRLAVKETALPGEAPTLEAIVPARALQELARLAADGGELRVGMEENHVAFAAGGAWLTTRRLDGRFHDYEPLVGGEFARQVDVPRDELLAAVGRASLLVQRNAPIELCFAAGELTLRVRTAELGEACERIALDAAPEPFEVAFNAAYLRDGLDSVAGSRVRFKMNDPIRPVVLQGADDDFAYLVAPMRLPARI